MSILAGLHHVTRYIYDKPIALGPQIVRLRPAPHGHTRIPSYSLTVTPKQHFVNWQQDPHGNWLRAFRLSGKGHRVFGDGRFPRRSRSRQSVRLFRRALRGEVAVRFSRRLEGRPCRPMSIPSRPGRSFRTLIDSISREQRNTVDFLVDLNQRIQQMVKYIVRLEPGVQTPEETLVSGYGSCRDSAWLTDAVPASHRPAGAFRVRLSHSVEAGHQIARRPERHRSRLHRSARLDRSLSAGRRLDRFRSDFRPVVRRRPFAGGGDAALPLGRADHRHGRNRAASISNSR